MLLINAIPTFAQKEFPGFGKIDKADLVMSECEFDKGAVAYKLLDYANVRYVQGNVFFKIQTDRRVRIKILKDKGLDNANIKIKFLQQIKL